jgi:tRNA threonylcarbamoyladenosine biosynthesis protein TsaB
MNALVMDTSTSFIFLYLIKDDKLVYKFEEEGENNHSEKLMLVIEEALKKNDLSVEDLDLIVTGIGPGSYTGLRISLTIAKMFAWTKKIPLKVISSLVFLGSGEPNGIYTVTNKAKKGYVYSLDMAINFDEIQILSKEKFISVEENIIEAAAKKVSYIRGPHYLINPFKIIKNAKEIESLHDLGPNYLREAI